jgi:hypothetical protein
MYVVMEGRIGSAYLPSVQDKTQSNAKKKAHMAFF